MRLLHGLLSWLNVPHRWARWMVLKAICRLVRLDYQLFELVNRSGRLTATLRLSASPIVSAAGDLDACSGSTPLSRHS